MIHIWENAEMKTSLCDIKVGEKHGATVVNQGLHGLKYFNRETAGKRMEVTGEAKVHKIKYQTDGFSCGLLGLPTTGEAKYEGKTTVRGFVDPGDGTTGAQIGVTWKE